MNISPIVYSSPEGRFDSGIDALERIGELHLDDEPLILPPHDAFMSPKIASILHNAVETSHVVLMEYAKPVMGAASRGTIRGGGGDDDRNDGSAMLEDAGERKSVSSSSLSASDLSVIEEESKESNELDVSRCSLGSMGEDEIQRTREQLGATSQAFIEHLRGAALKRKMDLARSRESLARKERQQRLMVAQETLDRERREAMAALHQSSAAVNGRQEMDSGFSFKARPLPSASGFKGNGGVMGVPKVDKRPPTVPVSPQLGAKRSVACKPTLHRNAGGTSGVPKVDKRPQTVPVSPQLGNKRQQNVANSQSQGKSNRKSMFQARPIPRWISRMSHAGQSGVPKVTKRVTTVPQSPLLGSRRPEEDRPKVKALTSSSDSRELNGLGMYELGMLDLEDKAENRTPQKRNCDNGDAFIPRSTARAQERASFEINRARNELKRREEARRRLSDQIREVKREMEVIRLQL